MNKTLLTLVFIIVSNITSAQVDTLKNGKHRMGNQGENFIGGGTFFKKRYELEGRTLLNNPFSDSLSENSGRIILNITVDSLGNVVNVSGPARGSSTEDSVLVSLSKISAYKAKFNASSVYPIQNGKISFMYFKK